MPLKHINPTDMYQPNKNLYSQVVKSSGNTTIHLAGTVPFDLEGNVVGNADMKTQVRQILENIRISLEAVGAKPKDVVRINVFTLDVNEYIQNGAPEIISFFGKNRPASTTVEVSRLVHPEWIVEIEATAVID